MKSELGIRHAYHHFGHRIDGHMFITLIAYHITHAICKKLKEAGINHGWEFISQAMCTQQRITAVLKRPNGNSIQVINTSLADPFQKKIYDALKMSYDPLRSVKIGT